MIDQVMIEGWPALIVFVAAAIGIGFVAAVLCALSAEAWRAWCGRRAARRFPARDVLLRG